MRAERNLYSLKTEDILGASPKRFRHHEKGHQISPELAGVSEIYQPNSYLANNHSTPFVTHDIYEIPTITKKIGRDPSDLQRSNIRLNDGQYNRSDSPSSPNLSPTGTKVMTILPSSNNHGNYHDYAHLDARVQKVQQPQDSLDLFKKNSPEPSPSKKMTASYQRAWEDFAKADFQFEKEKKAAEYSYLMEQSHVASPKKIESRNSYLEDAVKRRNSTIVEENEDSRRTRFRSVGKESLDAYKVEPSDTMSNANNGANMIKHKRSTSHAYSIPSLNLQSQSSLQNMPEDFSRKSQISPQKGAYLPKIGVNNSINNLNEREFAKNSNSPLKNTDFLMKNLISPTVAMQGKQQTFDFNQVLSQSNFILDPITHHKVYKPVCTRDPSYIQKALLFSGLQHRDTMKNNLA